MTGKIVFNRQHFLYGVIFFLVSFRYLLPYYFSHIAGETAVKIMAYVSLAFMWFFILTHKIALNRSILFVVVAYITALLSTVIGAGDISGMFFNGVYICSLCMFLSLLLNTPDQINLFIHVVRNITLCFFIINWAVGIILPSGIPSITASRLSPNFLYGNVNAALRCFFPGLLCSCLIDSKQKVTISVPTLVFFLGYMYFCFRIYFSATGFVGMLFVLLWIILRKLIKPVTYEVYIGVVVFVIVFEALVVLIGGNSWLGTYITSLFGKQVGFTGRGLLWNHAINEFKNHMLLGIGMQSDTIVQRVIGNRSGAHNYYLDLLWQRGVIGIVPVILFLIAPITKKIQMSESVYVLIGFCAAYLIMFLMEPFIRTEIFHIPIFFCMHLLLSGEKKIRTISFRIRKNEMNRR